MYIGLTSALLIIPPCGTHYDREAPAKTHTHTHTHTETHTNAHTPHRHTKRDLNRETHKCMSCWRQHVIALLGTQLLLTLCAGNSSFSSSLYREKPAKQAERETILLMGSIYCIKSTYWKRSVKNLFPNILSRPSSAIMNTHTFKSPGGRVHIK
jgi:hypothetical protein